MFSHIWMKITPICFSKLDIIASKIFKDKYCLREDFVNEKLGHNPSFVWRSIHTSHVVVREDLKLRVDDGSRIRGWYDPWIRDGGDHM